jgi:hypothetical protein
VVRITNKPTKPTLTEKFLQWTLNSLLVVLRRLRRLRLILTLVTLLGLLRLLSLLFLRELLGGLQDVEEVTAGLRISVSILILVFLGARAILFIWDRWGGNIQAWQLQQRPEPQPRGCPGHRPGGCWG